MSLVSLRTGLATAVVAAVCLALSPRPLAGPTAPRFERLVARAVNPADQAGATAPIDIVIERWSTDQESETLHTMLQGGPEKLLATLQHTRVRAGIMQLPGFQGLGTRVRERRSRILQFARDIKTPKGRQVVVALDQTVTLAQPLPLRGTGEDVRVPQFEFTLIDIRFGPDGKGIGKMVTAGKVAYNKNTRLIEIANYDSEPVWLTEVKSEPFDGGFARPARR